MKLRGIITNAWFLSMLPFAVIVLLFPLNISRYRLEILTSNFLTRNHYVYYDDLDSDSISEMITAFDGFNASGITIFNRDGVIEQWNFHGSFDFVDKSGIFISGDYDNNGKKEIYAFTISEDSLFLNCISDITRQELSIDRMLIAVTGKGIRRPDPVLLPAEMDDLDNDGFRELIFGINTGFSIHPRQVYAYNIRKDSLITSPESSYFLAGILQSDFNSDGRKEIIPWGYAAGNVEPGQAVYDDYSSFLMALDNNLRFIFNPVKFKGKYSSVTPFIVHEGLNRRLACIYSPPGGRDSVNVFVADQSGKLVDSAILGFRGRRVQNSGKSGRYIFEDDSYRLMLTDDNFKIIREKKYKSYVRILQLDIDNDGQEEIVANSPGENKLDVYREGLVSPATLDLVTKPEGWDILTVRRGYAGDPSLSLQSDQKNYILSYGKNPGYIYSFMYYPGIYLAVLAFAILMKAIQRNQLRKKYENEKKITGLQMALIRNQLDPHFTLNAINSIIYSVNYGDRNLAADMLRRFASLYRNLVLSAADSARSLKEEIAFCENYIALEKMRFGDKFDYIIDVSPEVDICIPVPKFIIQIYAENSLKHGLAPLDKGGMLKISVKKSGSNVIIIITDNGVGRKDLSTREGGTGKGLIIMDEMFSLYSKLNNQSITTEINDLYTETGEPAGTEIVIKVADPGAGKENKKG